MNLRPYQQEAVNAATTWMRRSIMPGLLELATGAGKSWIAAALAHWVYETSGKKTLVLQPSKELTEQNHEKYLHTGNPASIFSASAGGRCMRHNVIYGTPGTVKNSLSSFGDQFAAIIIDEAHSTTPTHRLIIDTMRNKNRNLRIIGMTATPYVMNKGYIYQYDVDGSFVEKAIDPYYNTLLFRVLTGELIEAGFLTPAHADPDVSAEYDAAGMTVNSRGKFDQEDLERVFEGKGRLTSEIVADVVRHSAGRKGVMLFAATVQHAKEIMESLPPGRSRMLGGDVNMDKKERAKLISDFKAQRFKYLVSVSTLTTGFDAPHVDVIALLRKTESPTLLQQIIGRGLRIAEGKPDCLVLDYAKNIEFHNLHDDLFAPEINVKRTSKGEPVYAQCPECSYINEFSGRPNPDKYLISEDGYFLDLDGNPLDDGDGPIPAHFGRRCTGQVRSLTQLGVYERCGYRWNGKECPECHKDNDIAARYCERCKAELVDPNEKLQREFIRVKKDPYAVSTDAVLAWTARKHISVNGNETLRCEYVTQYRTFTIYYTPGSRHPDAVHQWEIINRAVYSGHVAPDVDTFLQYLEKGRQPETVTYYKRRGSDFYTAISHNRPEDSLHEVS